MQSDACSHFGLVAFVGHLVEAMEYGFFQIVGYAASGVGYADAQILFGRVDRQGDRSSGGCVFECVGQDIEDDFVQFLLIDPYDRQPVGKPDIECDTLFFRQMFERADDFLNESCHVGGFRR